MSWAEVFKTNNDFANTSLDTLIHLQDYKMFGESSYVFRNKELLHGLYELTYLSMNDLDLCGEALEYHVKENKNVGSAFAAVFGIEKKELLETLTTMKAVTESNAAMQAIAKSDTAMKAISASNAAIQEVVKSSAALTVIFTNSEATQALLTNSTAMKIISASSKAIQTILTIPVALKAMVENIVAMKVIADSTIAMKVIAESSTAMQVVSESSTAMIVIAKNSIAMQEVAISTVAMATIANIMSAIKIALLSATAAEIIAKSPTALSALEKSKHLKSIIGASAAKTGKLIILKGKGNSYATSEYAYYIIDGANKTDNVDQLGMFIKLFPGKYATYMRTDYDSGDTLYYFDVA